MIGGKQCYVNYSRSEQINRGAATRVGSVTTVGGGTVVRTASLAHNGENVLLCTIHNPMYPITVRHRAV